MDFIRKLMATRAGWGIVVLRVPLGIVFIGHGWPKLFTSFGGNGLEATAAGFASMGLKPGLLMAGLAGSAEFFGGILLIIGFLARPAAFTLVITMLVAIFVVHFDNGLLGKGGYQWALIMCAASAAVMFDGAGRASLDRFITNKTL